jgi:putative ABC transport system substrate-binding protein
MFGLRNGILAGFPYSNFCPPGPGPRRCAGLVRGVYNDEVNRRDCNVAAWSRALGKAMRRRDFVKVILGAGVAWPVAARAQQTAMPVIGFLHSGRADARTNGFLAVFRRGRQQAGYVEGQNVAIEYRFADFKFDRLPTLAADLVHRKVALIFELGGGAAAALAAKAATPTIPIVLAFGSDPVKLGLVGSLSRSGGNVTGVTFFTTELVSKRVELLCEVLPQARTISYLRTGTESIPSRAVADQMEADARTAARALGRQIVMVTIDEVEELSTAFATLASERADALVIGASPFLDSEEVNDQLAALTLKHRLPTIGQYRAFPAAGGLMSYGANYGEASQQAGIYVGRILKGEKPADLPFQQSTRVELTINLRTAKLLGLAIPVSLLGRADEVIE